MSVCPTKLEYPKTSKRYLGIVLPIPTRLVAGLYTKFGAPSTSPAELWYWMSV